MAGAPIWYELMVPDAGAVAQFYKAVIGWDIAAEGMDMPNGAQYRMITRPDGGNAGGVLTLTQEMLAGGARPGWLSYFHVEDVDAAVEKAQALGAALWMAQDIPGTGRIAMLSDPQGAAFYVMKPIPPEGQPEARSDVFDQNKIGHCRWMQLNTPDAPAANEFYKQLFDWDTQNTMPMGPAGDYHFIEYDDKAIGAFNPMTDSGGMPHWLLFFAVEDIEAARAAAQANGGTITNDIHEVPGGDFIIVTKDPAGAVVGFVGAKGGQA